MGYIDLSHKLKNKINVYPGDPDFVLKDISDEKEDFSLFKLEASLHSGTHIDVPLHYIRKVELVSDISLNRLIGKASILKINNSTNYSQITGKNNIDGSNDIINNYTLNKKELKIESLKEIKSPLNNIVILKTGWFNNWGDNSYFYENPYLSKELAKLLIENEIFGIAIDSPSVDKYGENKIHKLLLKNNIWIVENLTNMDKLIKNSYYSYFVPMNINAEASFVRAFVKDSR